MGVLDGNDLQNINLKVAQRNAADNEPDLAHLTDRGSSILGYLRAIGERLDSQDGLPAGTLAARAAVLDPTPG